MAQAPAKDAVLAKAQAIKTFEIEWIVENGKNAAKPQKGQTVTVDCTGYGKNLDMTKIFWTTRKSDGADKEEPFSFQIGLGKVIKGWDQGVAQMAVGSRAKIWCSCEYAYGANGFAAWGIEKNSPLIFDITLKSIK